jgi:hypothetical protein
MRGVREAIAESEALITDLDCLSKEAPDAKRHTGNFEPNEAVKTVAYSGYHQIKMKESDQLATSFITPFGMYCYITMPFGLRNAGATYQRCMNHVFGEHIGRTVEAYVDDIVVKTRKASDLLSDLEVTFECLRAKGVKLNPEKCVFGVPRGMLLGFIVSERGIEANPEKIAAITNMGPSKI